MKIFTIGFTRKSAETFFTRLQHAGVTRIVDVRLNNVSQLAGFTKRDDLRYFAQQICHIEYVHVPALAPTPAMLDAYRKEDGNWSLYEERFVNLMRERQVERSVDRALMDGACLLCSEEKPAKCHRRLVAEYLSKCWGDVDIEHIP